MAAKSDIETPRPFTGAFRTWVQDCLVVLGISAWRLGKEIGLARNTLRDFLRDPARDIHLEPAHDISFKLKELAAQSGKSLPSLQVKL